MSTHAKSTLASGSDDATPAPAGAEHTSHQRGVYWVAPDGQRHPVHLYQGGDYALEDIAEYFGLGEATAGAPDTEGDDTSALRLQERELQELKVVADSQSFDFEPPFIEMCLEIYRFCQSRSSTVHVLVANF